MPTNKEILEQILEVIEDLKKKQDKIEDDLTKLKFDVFERFGKTDLAFEKETGKILLKVEQNIGSVKDGLIRGFDRYKEKVDNSINCHKNSTDKEITDIKTKEIGDMKTKISLINQKVGLIVAAVAIGVSTLVNVILYFIEK